MKVGVFLDFALYASIATVTMLLVISSNPDGVSMVMDAIGSVLPFSQFSLPSPPASLVTRIRAKEQLSSAERDTPSHRQKKTFQRSLLSTEGLQVWREELANPGTSRYWHGLVSLGSSILAFGGLDPANFLDDVWRSDDVGVSWFLVNSAVPWAPRWQFASVASGGSIFVFGGTKLRNITYFPPQCNYSAGYTMTSLNKSIIDNVTYDGMLINATHLYNITNATVAECTAGTAPEYDMLNDVWRSDNQGLDWTLVTSSAPFPARARTTTVSLGDKIYLMAGQRFLNDSEIRVQNPNFTVARTAVFNDVWEYTTSTNTWLMLTSAAPWSPRCDSVVTRLGFGDSLLLMGGSAPGNSSSSNDVWRFTSGTWTKLYDAAPWEARISSAAVNCNGSVFLIGGFSHHLAGYFNDVWRTEDGLSWTRSFAPFEGRSRFSLSAVQERAILISGGIPFKSTEGSWIFEPVQSSTTTAFQTTTRPPTTRPTTTRPTTAATTQATTQVTTQATTQASQAAATSIASTSAATLPLLTTTSSPPETSVAATTAPPQDSGGVPPGLPAVAAPVVAASAGVSAGSVVLGNAIAEVSGGTGAAGTAVLSGLAAQVQFIAISAEIGDKNAVTQEYSSLSSSFAWANYEAPALFEVGGAGECKEIGKVYVGQITASLGALFAAFVLREVVGFLARFFARCRNKCNEEQNFVVETPPSLVFPRWEISVLGTQILGLGKLAGTTLASPCQGWAIAGLLTLLFIPIAFFVASAAIVVHRLGRGKLAVFLSTEEILARSDLESRASASNLSGNSHEKQPNLLRRVAAKLRGIMNRRNHGEWEPIEASTEAVFKSVIEPYVGDYRGNCKYYFIWDIGKKIAVGVFTTGIRLSKVRMGLVISIFAIDALVIVAKRPFNFKVSNLIEGITSTSRVCTLLMVAFSSTGVVSPSIASTVMMFSVFLGVFLQITAMIFNGVVMFILSVVSVSDLLAARRETRASHARQHERHGHGHGHGHGHSHGHGHGHSSDSLSVSPVTATATTATAASGSGSSSGEEVATSVLGSKAGWSIAGLGAGVAGGWQPLTSPINSDTSNSSGSTSAGELESTLSFKSKARLSAAAGAAAGVASVAAASILAPSGGIRRGGGGGRSTTTSSGRASTVILGPSTRFTFGRQNAAPGDVTVVPTPSGGLNTNRQSRFSAAPSLRSFMGGTSQLARPQDAAPGLEMMPIPRSSNLGSISRVDEEEETVGGGVGSGGGRRGGQSQADVQKTSPAGIELSVNPFPSLPPSRAGAAFLSPPRGGAPSPSRGRGQEISPFNTAALRNPAFGSATSRPLQSFSPATPDFGAGGSASRSPLNAAGFGLQPPRMLRTAHSTGSTSISSGQLGSKAPASWPNQI